MSTYLLNVTDCLAANDKMAFFPKSERGYIEGSTESLRDGPAVVMGRQGDAQLSLLLFVASVSRNRKHGNIHLPFS